jgi:hypothetical protein
MNPGKCGAHPWLIVDLTCFWANRALYIAAAGVAAARK